MTLFRLTLIAIALLAAAILNTTTALLPERAFALSEASGPTGGIVYDDDEPTCNDSDGDGECDTSMPQD